MTLEMGAYAHGMLDADGVLYLAREAIFVGLPAVLVLLGLYVAIRAGVRHGVRDGLRDGRASLDPQRDGASTGFGNPPRP